jgi:hypothetical protein
VERWFDVTNHASTGVNGRPSHRRLGSNIVCCARIASLVTGGPFVTVMNGRPQHHIGLVADPAGAATTRNTYRAVRRELVVEWLNLCRR